MQFRKIPSAASFLTLLSAAASVYAGSLSSADKQFMITAAKTDMLEAHEGQMAENQGQKPAVKELAKALVQDHTQAYEQLTALASKTGVSIPKGINTAKEPGVTALMRLKGASFDKQFTREEVAAHKRVLAEFKREAASGQDPDVKAYAGSQIPVLEKHLQLAESCSK